MYIMSSIARFLCPSHLAVHLSYTQPAYTSTTSTKILIVTITVMASSQARSTTSKLPTLALITDINTLLDHYCSLCQYFDGEDGKHCEHNTEQKEQGSSSSMESEPSEYSTSTTSTTKREPAIKIPARIKVAPLTRQPALRHKLSPTLVSLRELRWQQQVQAQAMVHQVSSDEQLREMYEKQIMAYLGERQGTLDRIEE